MRHALILFCCLLSAQVVAPPRRATPAHPKAKQTRDCDTSDPSGSGVFVCAGGKWVHNAEAEKEIAERTQHVSELYWNLRTRVLTPAEEKEAYDLGDNLHRPCANYPFGGCSFSSEDELLYARELNDAWYQQRRLQMLQKLSCVAAQKQEQAK